MFWDWFLRYSSILITGAVSLVVGYLLHRFTTKNPDLVYYTSQPQWVTLPPAQGQPPTPPIGTFTVFLWNQGKAPAKEVHIGHYSLPANPAYNVYPDIPRETVNTPGGGWAIKFHVLPPRILISISYLFFGVYTVQNILSYVGSEDGAAKHIPVMLQRIWSPWVLKVTLMLMILGVWVAVNAFWSLISFLWTTYYVM